MPGAASPPPTLAWGSPVTGGAAVSWGCRMGPMSCGTNPELAPWPWSTRVHVSTALSQLSSGIQHACACTRACRCDCKWVRAHVCACMYMLLCTVCSCVRVHFHMHTCVHGCAFMCMGLASMYRHPHVCACTCVHTCTCMCPRKGWGLLSSA